MKNKKGKKLVVLGAMAALLTLIGVSGSQTYAKYVEATKVTTQQATVAKWDYTVSINAEKLFGTMHKKDAVGMSTIHNDSDTAIVYDSGAKNVVAPGTQGVITFGVVGYSEVAAEYFFELEEITQVKLASASVTYMPLKWTLEKYSTASSSFEPCEMTTTHNIYGGPEAAASFTYDLTDVKNAVEHSVYVKPETNVNETYKLSYVWEFKTSDQNDIYDTYLGEKAAELGIPAEFTTAVTTVGFKLSSGIEQVQKNA